jgi:hypothetical protein
MTGAGINYNAHDSKAVQPILIAYRQAMRQANKSVLDNEFTAYATHISNNVKPEKLLARLHLATLPRDDVIESICTSSAGDAAVPWSQACRKVSQRMGYCWSGSTTR